MAVNSESVGKSQSQPTTPVDNHDHHHHSDELLTISRPIAHQLSLSELSTAATAGGDIDHDRDQMNNLNSNLNLIHEAFYSHHQAAANNNIIKHVGGSGHSSHSAGGGTRVGSKGDVGHRLRPSVSASDSYLCGLPSYEGKSQTSNSHPR